MLQAISYASRGRLEDVIGRADYINVDIPSREIVQSAVRRLQSAGLVKADGTRVRATRGGRQLVRRSRREAGSDRGVNSYLVSALNELGEAEDVDDGWSLDRVTWEQAYERYLGRHEG